MKLKDYLKQFEGLDPEIEIYKDCSDKYGNFCWQVYRKENTIEGYACLDFQIGYVKDNNFITDFVLNQGEVYNKPILILV